MPALIPIGAAVAGAVVSSALSDDNGATGANDASAAATNQQAAIAKDQWDTYKSTYQPLEKQYVADAQNFDTTAHREQAAGLASSTVASQFGKARDRLGRTPGLDPSSAAYTSSLAGLDTTQAAADAVGQNAARQSVEDQGWARRTDALSLGKGLPAQASAGLSSVAAANASRAQMGMAQANAQGASIGRLVGRGLDAWGAPGGTTNSGYSPADPGRSAGDFNYTPETLPMPAGLDATFNL
jgi:hypothetical protein